jgi:hypothetical protein
MITPSELKKLVDEKERIYNKWVFDYEDTISMAIIKQLVKISPTTRNSLFRSIHGNIISKYTINQLCGICSSPFKIQLSKTKLLYAINKDDLIDTCDLCRELKEKERQSKQTEEAEIAKADYQKSKQEKTSSYIETFLNSNKEWNKGVKVYEKVRQLTQQNVDWEQIADHIKGMRYKTFLKTPYWLAIAQKVKQQAGFRCRLCKSNKQIATHHSSYDHHGYEHQYWREDLVCLCNKCHEKVHD